MSEITRVQGGGAAWREMVTNGIRRHTVCSPQHRAGRPMDTTALEFVVDRDADAVPRARRFAAEALREAIPDVADDAELVVSELVTNALLHGAHPVLLRIHSSSGHVRVEVQDAGREMPVRMANNPEAMTGRGLSLVAQLTHGWGVDAAQEAGKVVWAELSDEPGAGENSAGDVDIDALLAAWSDDEDDEPTYVVELGSVPTDLLLEAKAHIDNLVREFTLASAGAADGAAGLPGELADLVQTVVHGFSAARSAIKRQALEAAGRGDLETRLTLTLPASAADAGESYLAALDEADRYARTARLLTLEAPAVHQVFRRWYVESLITQLRRQVEGKQSQLPQTFLQRLAHDYARIAPMQAVAERL